MAVRKKSTKTKSKAKSKGSKGKVTKVAVPKTSVEKDTKTSPVVRDLLRNARLRVQWERESRSLERSSAAPLSDYVSSHGGLVPEEKQDSMTPQDCIDLLRGLVEMDPDRFFTRNYFRQVSGLKERVWTGFFGKFAEFKRAAGVTSPRPVQRLELDVAKHRAQDHYRAFSKIREEWGYKYLRPAKERFQLILAAADFHDRECDPFALRVFLDTARRAQPEIVCLAGDIFDLPEFGRYAVDPREWDVVGRITSVHDNILSPLRQAVPNAQIDLIEGNHEFRLAKHFADATPVMRAVLADLHGMNLEKLIGLDEFEVNYVGKADLAAWTKTDIHKEVAKNYRVYYDCVLAHHYKEGFKQGMWGVCGHHHKHEMFTGHKYINGQLCQFEFHQLGAMHIRDASYTDGQKWSNGFALIHVDTHTEQVAIEYVNVTDFACVGGAYYTRSDKETM